MKNQKVIITALTLFILAANILAQSGGNFTIQQSVIAGGGGQNSTGGTFSVDGTVGQAAAGGGLSGGSFSVSSGFWNFNSAPVSQTYEADVFPRPNGDNFVDSDDIQEIRRFALGLDSASLGGEYQRADCSFRNTLGDGYIDSDDVVQARRYALGLDTLQLAGGPSAPPPIAPPAADEQTAQTTTFTQATDKLALQPFGKPLAAPAAFRVDAQNTSAGATLTVPIRVDTVGNEAGYTFSIAFDSTKLTSPTVMIGNGGGDVIFNANNAGQIGFSVTSFSGGTIAAGNNIALVNVTFTVAAGCNSRHDTDHVYGYTGEAKGIGNRSEQSDHTADLCRRDDHDWRSDGGRCNHRRTGVDDGRTRHQKCFSDNNKFQRRDADDADKHVRLFPVQRYCGRCNIYDYRHRETLYIQSTDPGSYAVWRNQRH